MTNNPAKLEIRWSDDDSGDDEKVVIKGTLTCPETGKELMAYGLTKNHVMQQLNMKLLADITGKFINLSK